MEYLFNDWTNIHKRIAGQKNVILLCDYDGTLTPIVDLPELAVVSDEIKKRLLQLANRKHVLLGIISGRSLNDIKEKLDINGVIYAGNHGFEIEGPGLRYVHPLADEISSVLRLVSQVLKRTMNSIKGAVVEDKGMTLSVHYRLVDEAVLPELHNKFENIIKVPRVLGKIKVTGGKKVHEVRPAIAWDKGKAVNLIVEKYVPQGKRRDMLPIYMGDDRTDEDAFRVVNQYGGISIFVGSNGHQSAAKYYLNSISDVASFLSELYKLV